MTPLTIDRADLLSPWIIPPECGGQIVEYSYSATEDYVLECVYDRSDRSETITAYLRRGGVEPQNGAPSLGRRIGPVTLEGGAS